MQKLVFLKQRSLINKVVLVPAFVGLGAPDWNAAWFADQRAGVGPDEDGFAKERALERTIKPRMSSDARTQRFGAWQRAVQVTLSV
jgi:glycerol kinase